MITYKPAKPLMKPLFVLLLFISTFFLAKGQDKPAGAQSISKTVIVADTPHAAFVRHSVIATLAVGIIDDYRRNYTLPVGFEKNNFSGFAPLYGKLEYAVSSRVSVAATASYDAFYFNGYQLYYGNGVTFRRYRTDKMTIARYGVSAFYHFMPVKKLDAFVGVGLSLDKIHHTALPQGDSTAITTGHTVSPCLRAGARYYFADRAGIYADFGYDRQSTFCLGISTRFFSRKKK